MAPVIAKEVEWNWNYPDLGVAMRGLLSTELAAKAIEHSSYDTVAKITREFLKQYDFGDAGYLLRNKFTYQIAMVKEENTGKQALNLQRGKRPKPD
jgi:hypothetical protein